MSYFSVFGNPSSEIGEVVESYSTHIAGKRIDSKDVCCYVGKNGVDQFVGPQFEKDKKRLLFQNADELYVYKRHLFINGLDQGLDFFFEWFRREGDNIISIFYFSGNYKEERKISDLKSHLSEIYYCAGLLTERLWTAHLVKRLSHSIQRQEPIRFNMRSDNAILKPIRWIEVSPTTFKVSRKPLPLAMLKGENEIFYRRDELKSIKIVNGILKFTFPSKKRTKYQFKKTESQKIELRYLSNSELFLALLDNYGYSKFFPD